MAEDPNILVFAHHPCLDGVAAMWAVQQRYGDENVNFAGMDYANASMHSKIIQNTIKAHEGEKPLEIFFLDYLPNDTAVIQQLLDAGHKINIFDHHSTAEKNITEIQKENANNPALNAVFRHEKAGVVIAWEEIFPNAPTPALLELIGRMDVLDLQNQQEEQAAVYIDSFDLSHKPLDNLALITRLHEELERDGLNVLAGLGHDEWQRQVEQVSHILQNKTTIQIGDESFPAIRIGDITDLGRFGAKWVTDELISPQEPVGLMVKETPHMVTLSVRVHTSQSDETHEVVENLKAAADSVANASEKEKISGGGRGVNGQVGQGAIRMPAAVATRMGLIEPKQEKAVEVQR